MHISRETMTKISTDLAIQAFRDAERTRLLLDRKDAALTKALNGHIDMGRYTETTEQIRADYDAKREQAGL